MNLNLTITYFINQHIDNVHIYAYNKGESVPTVLSILNYLWVIHTRDHGYPHVTVYKGKPDNFEARAKIRLDHIEVIENSGFNEKSLNKLLKFTLEFQVFLLNEWSKYHEEE